MRVKTIVSLLSIIVALILFFSISKVLSIIFILIYFIVINYPIFLHYRGNYHYSKNNIDLALRNYEKVYKCFYSPAKLKISYTYVLILQGKLDKSEEVIKNIFKKKIARSEKINLEINYSLIMWKKGKLDKAIDMMSNVHENYKTIITYQNLGYFLILKGDYDKALEFNLEAYDYDASNLGILDNLAQNYYFLGNYDKAEELYERLMKKHPSFAGAYYNYALTLLKKNKEEEALTSLKQALNCKFTFLSDIKKEEVENKIKETENIHPIKPS
jgi:tetratricopeptide (TPR) repeat protein